MRRKIWYVVLTILFLSSVHLVEAQQRLKVARIGWLATIRQPFHEGFWQGLRELGYVERKTIVIEYRYAKDADQFRALAAELVGLKVDVIVAAGTPATLAAMHATKTIPILMVGIGDPVRSGLVASLARPGGNVTGLSTLNPELSGKRLELLKETFPKISRVAFLFNTDNPTSALNLKETEVVAQALGLKIQSLPFRDLSDLDKASSAITKGNIDALTMSRALGTVTQTQMVDIGTKTRLPVMYPAAEYADAGGLMAYGISDVDVYRRAATYLDKILKGRKPADLPVEQPMKFELIINLKAAKQIGLTIPPGVL